MTVKIKIATKMESANNKSLLLLFISWFKNIYNLNDCKKIKLFFKNFILFVLKVF